MFVHTDANSPRPSMPKMWIQLSLWYTNKRIQLAKCTCTGIPYKFLEIRLRGRHVNPSYIHHAQYRDMSANRKVTLTAAALSGELANPET